MSSPDRHVRRPVARVAAESPVMALGLTACAAGAAAAVGVGLGWGALGLLVLLLAAVWLCLMPVDWLPALALASFVLVPVLHLPLDSLNGAINPGIGIVFVWAIRLASGRGQVTFGAEVVPLGLLLLWVVWSTLYSARPETSLLWTVNFVVLVGLLGLLLPGQPVARELLLRTWLALGVSLGAYAVLELLVQANPILDWLYRSTGSLEQTWEVYRVTTTLGHPLVNGTFFAIAVVIALSRVLRTPSRGFVVATLCCLGGLVGTASRGAVLAAGVGVLLLLLGPMVRRGSEISRRALIPVVIVLVVAVCGAYMYLGARASGDEASGSTMVRQATYELGLEIAEDHWPWGAGPGIADNLKREAFAGDQDRGIESSYLQIAISLGLPGLMLLGFAALTAIARAIRRQPEIAAALVAYFVSVAFFNLIEAHRPALLLLGVLMGCVASSPPTSASASSSTGSTPSSRLTELPRSGQGLRTGRYRRAWT